jgi:methionine synthase / methylenetetrahydrofolate reductase(NADPH)
MDFTDELQSKIIPGDGAMGTMLMTSGVGLEQCFEELCVSDPDVVRGIHEQYIAAGARLIRTNSFGANAVRLARFGLEHRVNEINWSASQLARDCARGKGTRVAGSVGPLGISSAEAEAQGIDREDVFREQIGALLDGGAQMIFLETFTDLDELLLALYVKQSLHHCPAICSLASAIALGGAFEKMREKDADVVGVNCVDGAAMLRLLDEMAAPEIFSAFPSAGIPRKIDGRLEYDLTPDDFAKNARSLAEQGARLIGGCCGTTPEHIAAMTKELAADG